MIIIMIKDRYNKFKRKRLYLRGSLYIIMCFVLTALTPHSSMASRWQVIILVAVLVLAITAALVYQLLFPSSVIDQYAIQLRDMYTEKLKKCMDPDYDKFPADGRCVPFISMISIIVKKDSKKHWLHLDNVEYLQQDRNIKKIQIEDILKPVSDEQLRFVLIEGEPGIGKSTLAKELALRWAKKSDQLLSNYAIVIFIPLRLETYHKAKTIEDLFIDVEDISMTKVKSEIKKKNGAGVLWILDGFDELPINLRKNKSVFIQLINHEILYKSTVIVTGRPVASKPLLDFLPDNSSKCISLRGFDSNKTLEYASKYFQINNNEVIVSKFKDYYNGNLVIESMMYNPMTCYIVCTIFNDIIMANGTQYPRTMTSLYNRYVRVLLKRHLIYSQLVNRDYNLPERLIVQTDFINPVLESIWKNFTLLSEIAYDGVMKQKYVFGNELHNVTKLSMMDTIVSFSVFDKDESSSFIHITLQEYFAAIYIANNPKLKFTYNDQYNNPNLEVVLTFYVGIFKMVGKEVHEDNIIMYILKRSFIEKNNHLLIDNNLLCKCLYEHDSLMNFSGFQLSYTWVVRPRTKFDFFILGYLVAAHNITYEVTFNSLYQLHAFKGGLQFHSNVHVNGKLRIKIESGKWDLKEFLFIPSHVIIAFIGIDESFEKISILIRSNALLLSECEFISQFQLLQELSIKIDFSCSSEKVHPLLELKTLYKLTLQFDNNLIQEYDKLLNPLTAPDRQLKILHIKCSESLVYEYTEGKVFDRLYCVRQFPSLIQSQTSLEELKIDDIVVWHKSSNSLMISHQYQIIETSPAVTVNLTYISSFTYIRINKKLFTAIIGINSETVMSELSSFISAFENCKQLLKSSNIDSNVYHKIQLNPFMYAIVLLVEPIPFRYAYTCPCNTCNLKGFLFLYILHVSFVRVAIKLLAIFSIFMCLHLLIRLTYFVVNHTIHSNIMHPILIIDLIISDLETVILMYFGLLILLFLLFFSFCGLKYHVNYILFRT